MGKTVGQKSGATLPLTKAMSRSCPFNNESGVNDSVELDSADFGCLVSAKQRGVLLCSMIAPLKPRGLYFFENKNYI
jgi:hypothetical protein